MIKFILGALMMMSASNHQEVRNYPLPPTLDLSAVRSIQCDGWIGSGFLIEDHTMLTAGHISSLKNCVDADTGAHLTPLRSDPKHDLGLMWSMGLPTDIPYVKVTCDRFVTGKTYNSYGVTDYGQSRLILRMNAIKATSNYTSFLNFIGKKSSPGMRIFEGDNAPGTSGGPIVDPETGLAPGLVNAGNGKRALIYEFADGILCK